MFSHKEYYQKNKERLRKQRRENYLKNREKMRNIMERIKQLKEVINSEEAEE